MFDKDGDGVVTSEELQEVMKQMGYKEDSRLVRQMVRRVDLDGMFVSLVGV